MNSSVHCLEPIDQDADVIRELRERWDNRLTTPLSKLPERYVRGDLAILLNCSAHHGALFERERFSLLMFKDDPPKSLHRRWKGKDHIDAGIDNYKFPVLVESIHVMNDENGLTGRITPSSVWLQCANEFPNANIRDTLYLSLVSAKFVFVPWPMLKNAKFDGAGVINPRAIVRKKPNNMVENRPELMNNFPSENTEAQRNRLVSMVIDGLLPHLVIWMGDRWVLPVLDESVDLRLEIEDVLVGPF